MEKDVPNNQSIIDTDRSKFRKKRKKRQEVVFDDADEIEDSAVEQRAKKTEPIQDVYTWICSNLSYVKDVLILQNIEDSLRNDALDRAITEKQFQNEFARFLDRKGKFSEKELLATAMDICNVDSDEEGFVLIPANKHRNLFNKVKRAHDRDERKSKVWLDAFMQRYNVVSERDAKEKLYDWLENCIVVQKIKNKKTYTTAEREEIERICPSFDFVQTTEGVEKKKDWIDRWLADNDFTMKNSGFFGRLFGR